MIESEKVQELYESNEVFKKVCIGLTQGYDFCKIIDYDLTARTPNGVGWVTLTFPFNKNEPKCRVALSQVTLFENKLKKRKKAKKLKIKRRRK